MMFITAYIVLFLNGICKSEECVDDQLLRYALIMKEYETVGELIRNGSNMYVLGCTEKSLMNLAIKDRDMVLTLLENQFDLNRELPNGMTAFTEAIARPEETVRDLIALGGNVNARRASYGETLLHRAATKRDIRLASLLLKYNASVDVIDKCGLTAIFKAVGNNKTAMVNLLLAHGSKINEELFLYAMKSNSLDSLRVLLQHERSSFDDISAAIWKAVEVDNVEAASILKEFCGNCTQTVFGSSSFELMSWAARHNSVRSIEWLSRNGVSVSVQNQEYPGWTPLHEATFFGHLQAVKTLVTLGADKSKLDFSYSAPKDLARDKGYTDIVKVLES